MIDLKVIGKVKRLAEKLSSIRYYFVLKVNCIVRYWLDNQAEVIYWLESQEGVIYWLENQEGVIYWLENQEGVIY